MALPLERFLLGLELLVGFPADDESGDYPSDCFSDFSDVLKWKQQNQPPTFLF
jgi:hypothetical protein